MLFANDAGRGPRRGHHTRPASQWEGVGSPFLRWLQAGIAKGGAASIAVGMPMMAAGGVGPGLAANEEELSVGIPGAQRRAKPKIRNIVSMNSKRVALAAAAFALTLTAIPVQPVAAGPKQKAVEMVRGFCDQPINYGLCAVAYYVLTVIHLP